MTPTFTHPGWLWLLLLVPPLLWWWRHHGRTALRYSDTTLLAGLPRGRSHRAARLGLVLRGVGLASLIVALAGPRWPDPGSRILAEGIAVCMLVDQSASMANRDFIWQGEVLSRLEGVKNVLRLFVTGGEVAGGVMLPPRTQDLVMLVTFATRPETICPLTLDHQALLKILGDVEARTVATEATSNPGDALAWSLAAVHKAPTRRKVVIFLTDGESNVPLPALTPRQAAQLAGNLEIPIYAIGAGPDLDSKEAEAGKARTALEDVARISKGRYFQANDGKELAEACRSIDELERSRFPSFHYRRYHEGAMGFGLLALAAWTLVLTLESTLWRRIP